MTYVLVVDDEDDLRELLVEVLLEAGYRVLAANAGDEALRLMRASPPAFVVMDLVMPRMTGYTLAEEMENDPLLREIPFCVISASTFQPTPERAECVIRKPFQTAELLSAVARHVQPKDPINDSQPR